MKVKVCKFKKKCVIRYHTNGLKVHGTKPQNSFIITDNPHVQHTYRTIFTSSIVHNIVQWRPLYVHLVF